MASSIFKGSVITTMTDQRIPKDSASSASEDNIVLPTLKYGYRTEPLEWPELVQIIRVEHNLDKLARNEQQQRAYMIYMRELKKEWKSVMDFVLCSKFDLEQRTDDASGLWYAHPPVHQVSGIHSRLVKNDFPYYFQDNIEHWVFWKLGEECSLSDIEHAQQTLQEQLGDVIDTLHWINPPRLKSLPEVDHAHILVLRKSSKLS